MCHKAKVMAFVIAMTSLTQLWSLKGLPLHCPWPLGQLLCVNTLVRVGATRSSTLANLGLWGRLLPPLDSNLGHT